jgi:hypothetical protein
MTRWTRHVERKRLVGKPAGKRLLGKPWHTCEENIKLHVKERDVYWDQWRTLVSMVMSLELK